MADYLSHALFASDILANERFTLRDCCLRHATLFRFGVQGPDVFYYLGALYPMKRLGRLGDALHELTALDVLEFLHSRDCRERDYPFVCAYACGYAAHLFLDEAVHPYIEQRAQELSKELCVSRECAHVMLESQFESRQYFDVCGKQPSEYLLRADMPSNNAERATVYTVNRELLESCKLECADERTMLRGLLRLQNLLEFLFDKNGGASRFTDGLYRFTRSDFTARWHVKRPYPCESPVLTNDDYLALSGMYAKALEEYIYTMS